MAISKAEAYAQAASRLGSSASIDTIIREADKIRAYINDTTSGSGSAPVTAPATPPPDYRKVPAEFFMAEYRNKHAAGTHLGNKTYKTKDGALKNGRSRNSSLTSRFIRAVKFREVL